MNWLMWRLYRKTILVSALALAVYVALLAVTGLQVSNSYKQAVANGTLSTFTIPMIVSALSYLGLVFPILLGIFWGAPLLSKEYEDGTTKIVWTQSLTRRSWLSRKLLWILAATVLYGAVLSVSANWWIQAAPTLYQDRMQPLQFTTQGLMPLMGSLFAVAVGASMGAVTRRIMPALAWTLCIIVGLQFCVWFLVRNHYQTPITYTETVLLKQTESRVANKNGQYPSAGSWILSHTNSGAESCTQTRLANTGQTCVINTKYVYQPAERFWKFQIIEAILYTVLTAVALVATYSAVLRRDA
ncbi:MAG TPA: hypothetical protein VFT16_04810 [Candidatus Saccharimonadales bacterium]|nr:hypothetical protein [Candidatus Saccharimonadales bacterium]